MEITGNRYTLLVLALIGIFPFCVNGLVNSIIYQNPYLYWGFEGVIWILIPSIVLYVVLRQPGIGFSALGFHASLIGYRSPWMTVFLSLAFAPVCYWVYSTFLDVSELHFPGEGFFQYDVVIPPAGFLRLLVIAYFALSAGLVEEFLFRGLLFRAVTRFRNPTLLFLLISPLLFSLIHWESGLPNLVATYAYGWFAALAFIALRNIWPLILGHIYTDLIWFS